MKRIVFLLGLLAVLSVGASGQVAENTARVTVSGLPNAAAGKHKGYVVTDASNTSDCSVGGGTLIVRCWSDGTNWISSTADYVPKTTQVAGAALNGDVSAATIKTALGLVKGDVGLGNVDNTSDATKNSASVSLTNKKLGSLTSNGFVKTSAGDGTLSVDTATYLSGTLARANVDSTINGIGVVSTASVNGVAATDTQLLQITLPAGYLNISNGVVDVKASGTWTTGTTQTPTQNFKIKLCTVSGCGSGTVLTLLTMTSAAATASTTQTWIVTGTIGTVSTGSSGTLIAHGFADLPVGASANVAFAGFHDVNTAASAGIDLTAQLFLNLMWNVSTQSGTKNSAIGHMLSLKPRD